MKKLILTLAVAAGLGSPVFAQKYRTTAGLRFGRNEVGFTAQQLIMPNSTLEFLGMIGTRHTSATLLFEQHYPILGRGLNYYVGGGSHIGSLKEYGTFVGLDGILGLEAKVPLFRFTVSADIKPAIHAGHEDWFTFETGFSVRYIIVREKKKKRTGLFGLGKPAEPEKKGRIFGGKKQEETKTKQKFQWFGEEEKEEETKTKQKFWLFGEKEKEEEVKTKKKFRLFGEEEEEIKTKEKKKSWLFDE